MRRVLYASLALFAASAVVVHAGTAPPISVGFTAFFSTVDCPDGWERLDVGRGRLVVSIANASNSGVTVGSPLGDQEDRQHSHTYDGAAVLAEKSISALQADDHQAARQGTYALSSATYGHTSNYPFTQLPLCRFKGTSTNYTAGFGTIGFYSPDVSACPPNWAASHDLEGRIPVPGFSEGGPVPNSVPALQSGEDRQHVHNYSASFTTTDVSFAGVEGCCDHRPAQAGQVTFGGSTGSSSLGIPYVQLLTCVNQAQDFTTVLPPGALLFQEISCPPGWTIATTLSGRMLVGLPDGAPSGASFGGPSLPSTNPPTNPSHGHTVKGNITLPDTSVMLASGCCGSGYAGHGTYPYSGSAALDDGDLPYTMLPLCQQATDAMTLGRLL